MPARLTQELRVSLGAKNAGAPVPPGGLPKPGKIEVKMPNKHLEYALTWFGLALALAGVYVAWLAGRLRRDVH